MSAIILLFFSDSAYGSLGHFPSVTSHVLNGAPSYSAKNPCQMLSTDQVRSVIPGVDARPPTPSGNDCRYTGTNLTVDLNVPDPPPDGSVYEIYAANKPPLGCVQIYGIAEKASLCRDNARKLTVLKGYTGKSLRFSLTISGNSNTWQDLLGAQALAKLTTVALGVPDKPSGYPAIDPKSIKLGFLSKPTYGALGSHATKLDQERKDLTPVADSGDLAAQFKLARLFEFGDPAFNTPNFSPSYKAAAYWYRRAAATSSAGVYQLGRVLLTAPGLADSNTATQLLLMALQNGYQPAAARLGNFYLTQATPAARNLAEPLLWMSMVSGDASVLIDLGMVHAGRGDEIKGDLTKAERDAEYSKAVTLFEKSASDGDCTAYLRLGMMHAAGAGVPQDQNAAKTWYTKAINCPGNFAYRQLASQKLHEPPPELAGTAHPSTASILSDDQQYNRLFTGIFTSLAAQAAKEAEEFKKLPPEEQRKIRERQAAIAQQDEEFREQRVIDYNRCKLMYGWQMCTPP
jgi:TPR repeat protein